MNRVTLCFAVQVGAGDKQVTAEGRLELAGLLEKAVEAGHAEPSETDVGCYLSEPLLSQKENQASLKMANRSWHRHLSNLPECLTLNSKEYSL